MQQRQVRLQVQQTETTTTSTTSSTSLESSLEVIPVLPNNHLEELYNYVREREGPLHANFNVIYRGHRSQLHNNINMNILNFINYRRIENNLTPLRLGNERLDVQNPYNNRVLDEFIALLDNLNINDNDNVVDFEFHIPDEPIAPELNLPNNERALIEARDYQFLFNVLHNDQLLEFIFDGDDFYQIEAEVNIIDGLDNNHHDEVTLEINEPMPPREPELVDLGENVDIIVENDVNNIELDVLSWSSSLEAPLFEVDPNIAHLDDVVEVEGGPLRAVSPILRDVLFIPSDTASDNNSNDDDNDENDNGDQASPAQQFQLTCKNDDVFSIKRPQLIKEMKPPFTGSFDCFKSKDHVYNTVTQTGARFYIPKNYSNFAITPSKNSFLIQPLLDAGILEISNTITHAHQLFPVPKNETTDRCIYDMSPLTPFLNPPKFSLPNLSKSFNAAGAFRDPYMCKIDLSNGFYHISLDPKCRKYFGVSCEGQKYRFTKIPMGFSLSPYIMQRVTQRFFIHKAEQLFGDKYKMHIHILVYLDDILLIGNKNSLIDYVSSLKDSLISINYRKSVIEPCKTLEYLGCHIDLAHSKVTLTSKFVEKIHRFFEYGKYKVDLSDKFWQRLAGILNFVQPILKLPFFIVQMSYIKDRRLFSLTDLFHSRPVNVGHTISGMVFADATPTTPCYF